MGINSDIAQNTITTTDSTPTSAVTYALPANAAALIQVRLVGMNISQQDGSQNTVAIESRVVVKRTSGSCSIVGTGETSLVKQTDSALSAAWAAVAVNGSSIQVNVNGIDEVTISWGVRLDVIYLN